MTDDTKKPILTPSRPMRPADYGTPSGVHVPAALAAAAGLIAIVAAVAVML